MPMGTLSPWRGAPRAGFAPGAVSPLSRCELAPLRDPGAASGAPAQRQAPARRGQ
jgi:hypothetical protein